MAPLFAERARTLAEKGQGVKTLPFHLKPAAAVDLAEQTAALLVDMAEALDKIGGDNAQT